MDTARHVAGPLPQPVPAGGIALPSILTDLSAAQIRERLTTASRRGRLAGFDPRPRDGALFAAAAHAHPFDSLLLGELRDGRIQFRLVMLRKIPLLFGAVLIFTIW